MHLVLVTSVLRPVRDTTAFSTRERLEQTLATIDTVRQKIPCRLVLIEGGRLEETEIQLLESKVDYLFRTEVGHLTKSPGEATLLYNYLSSDDFKSLDSIETVSKISGRYYLDENFNWDNLPLDKTIICYIPQSWMGKPMYNTRYYRFPWDHVKNFIEGLLRYLNSREFVVSHPDIEHCFFEHNIILHDQVYSPQVLGVSGLLTSNKQLVSD